MISLDYKDKRPIYEQITEKMKELMALGAFPENTKLPSVRSLAVDLSINPNTIQRAYAELERQGYIYSIKGKGNFAADNERLRDLKIDEIKKRLREVADAAKNIGMSDEEIMAVVKNNKESGGGRQ